MAMRITSTAKGIPDRKCSGCGQLTLARLPEPDMAVCMRCGKEQNPNLAEVVEKPKVIFNNPSL